MSALCLYFLHLHWKLLTFGNKALCDSDVSLYAQYYTIITKCTMTYNGFNFAKIFLTAVLDAIAPFQNLCIAYTQHPTQVTFTQHAPLWTWQDHSTYGKRKNKWDMLQQSTMLTWCFADWKRAQMYMVHC